MRPRTLDSRHPDQPLPLLLRQLLRLKPRDSRERQPAGDWGGSVLASPLRAECQAQPAGGLV